MSLNFDLFQKGQKITSSGPSFTPIFAKKISYETYYF